MRNLVLFCGLLAGGLLALPGAGQALDPTFTSPSSCYASGSVFSMGPAQTDGKRVLAGSFTRASGQAVSQVLRLDASGNLDQTFSANIGTAANVYRVAAGLNGQYLLGAWGGNITAGGIVRTEVLRLNADGTADASFDGGSGPALTNDFGYAESYATQPDGKVLVGGYFDSYSGTGAPSLVRLNVNGSLDTSFILNLGSGVSAANGDEIIGLAAQPDGKVLVAGYFTSFNGHAANGLVRLNADGSYDTSFTAGIPSNSSVSGLLLQPDGKALVYGNVGTAPGLVRLLPSGALDTGFSASSLSGGIYANWLDAPIALQSDGKILVIGEFTNISGTAYAARLNANGSVDYSFVPAPGPTTELSAVGIQPNGTVLLAAANALSSFGTTDAAVAQFSSTGTLQSSYAPKLQLPGTVQTTLLLSDGSLLVGGNFAEWSGQAVHRLVRLSSTGALNTSFTASLGGVLGTVSALAQQPDGKLLVGSSRGLLRTLVGGIPDGTFTQFTNSVSALALQPDGKVLVGGPFFVSSGGTIHRGLLRLSSTGSLDNTFVRGTATVGTASGLSALVLQPDGKVAVAGTFAPIGGGSSPYVVRYESTGSVDATFTPLKFTGTGARLYTLVRQPDGKLLAGGTFIQAGGLSLMGLARLETSGQLDGSFGLGTSLGGLVQSVAVQPNGRLLVGGRFATSGGYLNLARLLANGQFDTSFSGAGSAAPGAVTSLLVQPDGGIVAGGTFTSIGGQPALYLARLTAPNVLAVAAPATVAAATSAWPVPAHERLHVLPAASAHPLDAELLDALGRLVRQQPLAGPAEFTLDTSSLPAGRYVLRLRYAEGTVSRQVSVE